MLAAPNTTVQRADAYGIFLNPTISIWPLKVILRKIAIIYVLEDE